MIDQEKTYPIEVRRNIWDNPKRPENKQVIVKKAREHEDGSARYEFLQPGGNREIWYETYDSWDYAPDGSKLPYHGIVIDLTEKHMADDKWPYRKGEFFYLSRMKVTQKDFTSGERKITLTVPGRWRNSKEDHNDVEYDMDGQKQWYDGVRWAGKTDLTPFIPKARELPEKIDTPATIQQFLNQIAAFDFSDPQLVLPAPVSTPIFQEL
jgi:hypothetical protein